jgi:uncharacterized protein (TIGR00661 family)
MPELKIFCGVQATGRGHLSRYLVAKEILEAAGHEVYGYSSGPELPSYASGINRFDPGPTFFISGNRVDLLKSIRYNVRHLAGYFRSIADVKRIMISEGFDDIIIDFEPISARAVRKAKLPFTIFDNQTASLLEFDYPPHVMRMVRKMRRFVEFYYGSVLRARRILTYSFAPLRAQLPLQQIIPPCVRKQVFELSPIRGDHILFYSSIGELPPGLVQFARENPTIEVRAYVQSVGSHQTTPNNVTLPDRNSSNFLRDFANCRVFVANAGFESLAEAIVLQKPVVIVPIEGQWEQQINAYLIERFRVGLTSGDFSIETFNAAIRHEQPPAKDVYDWVLQGRQRLEHALTDGS